MNALLSFFASGPDRPLITDRDTVDSLYRKYRIQVMVGITGGYALSYTCRLAMSVVKKPLIDEGVFTATDLGNIGSVLFYSYALAKLTNGFLGDHANIKRFFAFGIFMSALLCAGMGASTLLWVSMLLWGLNGWFQGFGAPSAVVSLANWFANHERGRFYGIWSTSHSVGEGLTYFGVAWVVSHYGWRWGFYGSGLLCAVAALVCYRLVQDRPRTLGLPHIADRKTDHAAATDPAAASAVEGSRGRVFLTQLDLLKQPAMWALALSSALMYVTRYGIASWGMLYMEEAHHYKAGAAALMLTLGTLAGVAGCIAYGFLSDLLFKSRRPPANVLFGLLELIGLGLVFWGPSNPWSVGLGFILFGFGINGLITSLGGLFAVDISPKQVAGAALGFVGVFSYLGAGLQDNISGVLIDKGTTMIAGVRHYDFQPVLLFWFGASLLSLILATTLWRARLKD
ncbi:MAG: transporter [Caulobacter sp.]|nr:transporter [Caulobacter sp.]